MTAYAFPFADLLFSPNKTSLTFDSASPLMYLIPHHRILQPKWVNGNKWTHTIESRDHRLYEENKQLKKEGKLSKTISGI